MSLCYVDNQSQRSCSIRSWLTSLRKAGEQSQDAFDSSDDDWGDLYSRRRYKDNDQHKWSPARSWDYGVHVGQCLWSMPAIQEMETSYAQHRALMSMTETQISHNYSLPYGGLSWTKPHINIRSKSLFRRNLTLLDRKLYLVKITALILKDLTHGYRGLDVEGSFSRRSRHNFATVF